jgi:hypothetical protein
MLVPSLYVQFRYCAKFIEQCYREAILMHYRSPLLDGRRVRIFCQNLPLEKKTRCSVLLHFSSSLLSPFVQKNIYSKLTYITMRGIVYFDIDITQTFRRAVWWYGRPHKCRFNIILRTTRRNIWYLDLQSSQAFLQKLWLTHFPAFII